MDSRGSTSPSFSFADFLEKMKDPTAADLVRSIKAFIRDFETRHADKSKPPDPNVDSAAVQDFLSRMDAAFRVHPTWQGVGLDVLSQAGEGLEKYIMSKLWPRTFASCREDRDRDERYARLAAALAFVDLSGLMGGDADVSPEPALLAAAQGELLRMDKYKAPRDKLLCLVNVKTLVEDIVAAAVRAGADIGGADAFFPVFLLVIIRARLPHLASTIEYVRRFRARDRLTGQFDYMLANLESAAMYLDTVDWRHLRISQDEFLARLADAGIPEAELELRALRSVSGEGFESGSGGPGGGGGTGVSHDLVELAQEGETTAVQYEELADDIIGRSEEAKSATVPFEAAEDTASDVASPESLSSMQPASAAAAVASLGGETSGLLDEQPRETAHGTLMDTHYRNEIEEEEEEAMAATVGEAEPLPVNAEADSAMVAIAGEESKRDIEPTSTLHFDVANASASADDGHEDEASSTAAQKRDVSLPLLDVDLQPPGISEPSPSSLATATTTALGGLTPIGAGPFTPTLLVGPTTQPGKQPSPEADELAHNRPNTVTTSDEEQQRLKSSRALHESSPRFPQETGAGPMTELLAKGAALVLEEETTGRLQARYPYMYACSRDLTVADVGKLLAAYRELALRHEALALALQHQSSGFEKESGQGGDDTMPRQLTSGLDMHAIGASLMQKFAAWGRVGTGTSGAMSGKPEEGGGREQAAALKGKSGDVQFLAALFGSPRQPSGRGASSTSDGVNLVGENIPQGVDTGDAVLETGNLLGSPAMGLVDRGEEEEKELNLI